MRTGATLFLAILLTGGIAYAAPSPLEVYDVTTYGATGAYDCASDQAGIQAAIEAAHAARGGTVYFPAGYYCITGEILGHENITLKGASMAGANASSASVLETAPDFDGTGATIIGMANKNGGNYGFALEDLSIYVPVITSDESAGFTVVDFTGAWYGAIRGVAVAGEAFGPDPYLVHSANSVGFLFDDNEGESASFGTIVERTSASTW